MAILSKGEIKVQQVTCHVTFSIVPTPFTWCYRLLHWMLALEWLSGNGIIFSKYKNFKVRVEGDWLKIQMGRGQEGGCEAREGERERSVRELPTQEISLTYPHKQPVLVSIKGKWISPQRGFFRPTVSMQHKAAARPNKLQRRQHPNLILNHWRKLCSFLPLFCPHSLAI